LKNSILFYWTCDKSENSGEGKLALIFIKKLKKKFKTIEIKKPNIKNKMLKNLLYFKYILPFVGILYCWKYYINNKKACYINYLPFWNFLIFMMLPPNTIIGPITGGARFNKNSSVIRAIFFPIFYKISELVVNLRNFDLIFSTELLKSFLSKKTVSKSSFNFAIKEFIFKKKNFVKTIDFIVYYRNHKNKKKFFPIRLIQDLVSKGYRINVIGDRLKIPNLINKGYLKNKDLIKLQKKARYTISSNENLYSFFTLECIINNVFVVLEKSLNYKIPFFKDRFIRIDFNNPKELQKLKKIYKNNL
tara:strand:- start:476 stop:1387 length:912 start_codon:yes stop_codon:yes gene_type:complete